MLYFVWFAGAGRLIVSCAHDSMHDAANANVRILFFMMCVDDVVIVFVQIYKKNGRVKIVVRKNSLRSNFFVLLSLCL